MLLAVLTPVCALLRGDLSLASDLLLFLLVVVIASLIGGFYPALAAAVAASLLLNYYFVPADPHLHHLGAGERPRPGRVRR